MFRTLRLACVGLLLLLISIESAQAQDWAKKLFKVSSHDFGYVAKGAKAEFSFELTNIFKEEIHVASVRASCGCTTPSIIKDRLKTYEKGAILAKFNTRSFNGQKSATITVTIDEPYYAEVQLTVKGYIRTDVVLHPGVAEFGTVDQGSARERTIAVNYAGRDDWKILDVRSSNKNFEVRMEETKRGNGQVGYNLIVRLKDSAPAGFFREELILVTNDRRSKKISLPIEGHVVAPLSVSPASLSLGVVQPGQTKTGKLIVRGKKPFKIIGIDCANKCFKLETSDESKTLHVVPVTFTADKTGKIVQKIEIKTDLGDNIATSFVASVVVKAAEGSE